MIRLVLIAYVLFLILDAVWLGVVTRSIYLEEFKTIGRIADGKFQIVYSAGAVVYLLLALGLAHFVFPKFDSTTTLRDIFLTGALFGLITYGVYDMTNYATLKDFSLKIAFIDMAWGTFVCGAVTALTYWISAKFN